MSHTRRSIPRGLTLIELLAVVVILALVSSLGIAGLASIDDAAKIERFVFEWRELDARARIVAQTSEYTASLHLLVQREAVVLVVGEKALGTARLDSVDAICRALIDESDTTAIAYDTRGCSPDYTLLVQAPSRAHRWMISGETGWIESERGDSP